MSPGNGCYVGGSFDLFHVGHVNLLRRAAAYGPVTAAVNSDVFHHQYRHRLPVIGEEDRLAVVRACRYVTAAFVVPDREVQPGLILSVAPAYIVHGDDWVGESLLRQLAISQRFLDDHGISMLYLPYTPGVSSTMIRQQHLA